MQPAAGTLLVATAVLSDPSFLRSVVYLLEHDEGGSLGFIVNRPLDIPLSDLWSECPPGLIAARIAAEGGPVDRHKGLLLHACPDLPGAQEMGGGLAVHGQPAALAERWPQGPDARGPRLFLGHSGWAPGQLAGEIAQGAWIVRPGRIELVLGLRPPETLWQQLLEGSMGLPRPSVN